MTNKNDTIALADRIAGPLPRREGTFTGALMDEYRITVTSAERDLIVAALRAYRDPGPFFDAIKRVLIAGLKADMDSLLARWEHWHERAHRAEERCEVYKGQVWAGSNEIRLLKAKVAELEAATPGGLERR